MEQHFTWMIFVYYQTGNIGPQEVEPLKEQPEKGFSTEWEAESFLLHLIEKCEEIYFTRPWYHFTILKTYKSKNALDKKRNG